MEVSRSLVQGHRARLAKIRLFLLDVDGVMTDGTIFWSTTGWTRYFNIHDGYGIKLLQGCGIIVGVLSGGSSTDVRERLSGLNIQHAHLGNENKIIGLEQIQAATGFTDEQCAFMGDDLFDLPVLKRVGLSLSVPNAVAAVRDAVHYTTRIPGGRGAVREVIEGLLEVLGTQPVLPVNKRAELGL